MVMRPSLFDERATDFLTWFDDQSAKNALQEFAVQFYGGKVKNANAFLTG